VLEGVGLIAAEDTRVTRKLLGYFGIRVPLLSYNEHNAAQRLPRILEALEAGDVALVSDAGAPAVSDPGSEMAHEVAERGFRVVPVPGPSAVTAALSVAGMRADSFVFLGFPPRTRKQRVALFESVGQMPRTLVFFEAPHRLRVSLADLLAALGDRRIAVCREMTKLYEEVFRGTVSEALVHFTQPRGEFVVVMEGAKGAPGKPEVDELAVRNEIALLKAQGLSRKDAVARLSPIHGVSRRQAYRLWLEG